MSTLDQPILIANSNYHVGHQVAIFVAEEQGFFREEGLKEYEYDSRGLIPGPIEREGLGARLKITALILRPPSMSRRRFTSVRSESMSTSLAAGATRRFSGGTARSM